MTTSVIDVARRVEPLSDAEGGTAAPRRAGAAARLWESPWPWAVLVVLVFGLPLFINIGRTDYENDEAFHSMTVERMVEDGDWLTPKNVTQGGGPFLEKPPLKFWVVALPIRLGLLPANEFGMRFCDVIITTVAFLYVFAIGRRLAGPLCGLGALVILVAHQPLLYNHGLLANDMESTLFLAYSAGIYHYLAWRTAANGHDGRAHVLAIALYVALGFMVKFVAIAFLPLVLLVATVPSASARARLRSDWRVWLGASALAAAVVAPWFLYQFHQFGRDFWGVIFGVHVLTRFTSYLDPDHLHPWHFYWTTIFGIFRESGAVPGVGLGLVLLAIGAWRARSGRVVLLIWLALPLALMSLMTSKVYHYAYPYLPPFAIAGGYAAALAASRAWAVRLPWVDRLDSSVANHLPAVLRSRAVSAALLVLGLAAVGTAVATQINGGHVHVAIGQVVLFRNASALRAWLIAIPLLVLACRLATGLRVALVALVVVLLLPVSGYASSVARLPVQQHRLRSIGLCAKAVLDRARPGEAGRGVWIEADGIAHFWYAYLHQLGPWQKREFASDPTVFMHIYIPSMRTPVLLSRARYTEFNGRISTGQQELMERVARKTGLDVATVKADTDGTYVTTVQFPGEVLLLPGPFSVCATETGR